MGRRNFGRPRRKLSPMESAALDRSIGQVSVIGRLLKCAADGTGSCARTDALGSSKWRFRYGDLHVAIAGGRGQGDHRSAVPGLAVAHIDGFPPGCRLGSPPPANDARRRRARRRGLRLRSAVVAAAGQRRPAAVTSGRLGGGRLPSRRTASSTARRYYVILGSGFRSGTRRVSKSTRPFGSGTSGRRTVKNHPMTLSSARCQVVPRRWPPIDRLRPPQARLGDGGVTFARNGGVFPARRNEVFCLGSNPLGPIEFLTLTGLADFVGAGSDSPS
jgi:hypothetical protein